MRVALVTDSTASLSSRTAAEHDVRVVPLQVVIGDTAHEEGSEAASPQRLAAALRERRRPVSTSRPAPEVVLATYEELVREGYDEIVSVHLSGELSGTARILPAASRAPRVSSSEPAASPSTLHTCGGTARTP